jgi:hypothetical protein
MLETLFDVNKFKKYPKQYVGFDVLKKLHL